MGSTDANHRPLLSGTRITTRHRLPGPVLPGETPQSVHLSAGTLTGLARRNSDGQKMLVTNLHVMAGVDIDLDPATGGRIRVRRNLSADRAEEMYQGGETAGDKVGTNPKSPT